MPRRPPSALRALLTGEAGGGLVLMASAALALAIANSPLSDGYFHLLHIQLAGLSLLHWVNDGFMALFFLLVGLEIKRELLDGQLAQWRDRMLPGVAAAGGMAVPALVYLAANAGEGGAMRGWAIPSATDIAFALGVLALLGPRVPVSLKIFLTALAILDDLGAVLIIALFYTAGLSAPALAGAAAVFAGLCALNLMKVERLAPYLALGAVLWVLVLLSGVHATVAGVLTAMAVPLRRSPGHVDAAASPLHRLEHALSPVVAYAILPVFGFANAGVSFSGVETAMLIDPVVVGIALGLFAGKQAGVFACVWAAAKSGLAARPAGASWRQVYGVAVLCGIGFTMSLFIGGLAFPGEVALETEVKIGVLIGSLASAALGWAVLRAGPAVQTRKHGRDAP